MGFISTPCLEIIAVKSLIAVAASLAGFSCLALEVRSEGLQQFPPLVPADCSPAWLCSICSQLQRSAQEEENKPLCHRLKLFHRPTLRQKLRAGRSHFVELILQAFGFQPFPLWDAGLQEGVAQALLCLVTLRWSCPLPPCREHRKACPYLTLPLPQPACGTWGCDPTISPFALSLWPQGAHPGPGAPWAELSTLRRPQAWRCRCER